MRVTDKYVFFFQSTLGQWNMSDMVVDGITYNCCEQYMMYQKAILFEDYDIADKILATSHPKDQKALGRQVKNFNLAIWEEHAKDIVYEANYAKFTQHKHHYERLMSFGDRQFVEASPYDPVWGIKMGMNDPGVEDPRNWKGTNWLGEVLTELRDNLKIDPPF